MIDDVLKKVIARHETALSRADSLLHVQKEAERLAVSFRTYETSSVMKTLAENMANHEQMMRTILGPIDELRQTSNLIANQLASQITPIQSMIEDINKRFYVPDASELARGFHEMKLNDSVTSLMKQYSDEATKIRESIIAMHSPWADIQNIGSSIAGLAEMQSIGHALKSMPYFDVKLTEALRLDLGDWRKEISWPQEIFINPLARTEFYTARGLNPGLTMFPSEAFEQGVRIAGLADTPPPAIDIYDRDTQVPDEDDEEAGFTRTNTAHDHLQRFETYMRRFIDQRMTEQFGENWIKHRTPGELRKAWIDKKQKAQDNGEREYPLIAYADFTDYVTILTRSDNWNDVFKPVFRRKEFVQESFQRLYPIRICTMHSRIITQDDELFLYVEVKRLLKAIGITEQHS